MRTTTRPALLAVGAVATLALSLTACNDGSGTQDSAVGTSASSAAPSGATSAPASAPAAHSASAPAAGSASAPSGGRTSTSGGGSSSSGTGGGGVTAACTTKNTSVTFLQSSGHASDAQPAAATLKITNSSGAPCTIVGPTTVVADDDQGKASPVSGDNSKDGSDAVDVPAGAAVVADVLYNDVNSKGTTSARYTCPVQASHVKVALPKDVGTTVNVMKANGSPGGVFSVCGTDFKVGAFAAR
ncbi:MULTISPECIES: DUF4232 domain-containing protein [Kitasatospora]|uniref:DUF4232 domain-containing protein n=1 Tax=Kitasatospora cathayae TaxID=3004092 RepID=A0ABY7Q118_9ACTN|nr:DUF4232 domain-containing protein [Kitasatospora sp. HUAS 3-15]WBP86356.1 DUF4232 domain-containing protein [Kitasatospora sp. HUAS 3-15]